MTRNITSYVNIMINQEENASSSLEKRVQYLENLAQALEWVLATVILGAISGVIFFQGKTEEKTIRTRALEIRDNHGFTRAVMKVNRKGPTLTFRCSDGKPGFIMGVANDRPVWGMFDSHGVNRVSFESVESTSGFYLVMRDKMKTRRLLLGTKGDETSLVFCDSSGTERLVLDADRNLANLTISDTKGGRRIKLVSSDEKSALIIFDEHSQPRSLLGVIDNNTIFSQDETLSSDGAD